MVYKNLPHLKAVKPAHPVELLATIKIKLQIFFFLVLACLNLTSLTSHLPNKYRSQSKTCSIVEDTHLWSY